LDGHDAVIGSAAGRRLHARLSLRAAVLGLSPLARGDPQAQQELRALPCGLAAFSIGGDPSATTWFDHGSDDCAAGYGDPPRLPEVRILFNDVETAFGALRDEIDAMAAMGTGRIRVDGLVPLADGLNAVMQRLRVYLQP
jgi:hypothetical protein